MRYPPLPYKFESPRSPPLPHWAGRFWNLPAPSLRRGLAAAGLRGAFGGLHCVAAVGPRTPCLSPRGRGLRPLGPRVERGARPGLEPGTLKPEGGGHDSSSRSREPTALLTLPHPHLQAGGPNPKATLPHGEARGEGNKGIADLLARGC